MKKIIVRTILITLAAVLTAGCGKVDTTYALQMKNVFSQENSFEGYVDIENLKTAKTLDYDPEACCPGGQDIAKQLLEGLDFSDTLLEVNQGDIPKFIDAVDGACGVLYMGSGSTVDVIAIFECQNAEIATAQEEYLRAFIKDQEASFEKYIPLEAKRAKEALIFTQNNFTGLVICNNQDWALEIMQQVF